MLARASRLPLRTTARPINRRTVPWKDIGLVMACALVLPFSVYLTIAVLSYPADPIGYLMVVVAVVYTVTGIAVTTESLIAARRRRAEVPLTSATGRACDDWPHRNGLAASPPVTALVVAYLPNEQDIILETLENLLCETAIAPERLQVILAYNTPETLPVERELQRLAASDPRLVVLRVDRSRSKAENVNAALPHITGEIVGIFDSDHHPEPLCFQKALRWLGPNGDYDAVQGRCTIRNSQENWLTRIIGIEFGTMYAVSHAARSLGADTAIFGGSNGYWRTKVLRSLRLDSSMLTEDIDLTVRTLMAGFRIVHDRSIISTELAPTTLTSWFYQRLRWAQGWHQVALKYGLSLFRSPALNLQQKLCWSYVLPWREVSALVTPQIVPILLTELLILVRYGETWYWDPYLTATTALTFVSGMLTVLVAYRHLTLAQAPVHVLDVFVYIAIGPFFALIRNSVTLVAWLREARRQHEWVTTARGRVRSGTNVRPRVAAWPIPALETVAVVAKQEELASVHIAEPSMTR